MNPDVHHSDCPSVPTPSAGTVGHLGQNSGTPVGQGWDSAVPNTPNPKAALGTLKALAHKVLSATVPAIPLPTHGTVGHPAEKAGHPWDSSGTEVSQTVGQQPLSVGQLTDLEYEASMKRLEAARVSVAVWPDGRMKIVTAGSINQSWRDGAAVYTPGEMLDYVQLSPAERKLFRELKGVKP